MSRIQSFKAAAMALLAAAALALCMLPMTAFAAADNPIDKVNVNVGSVEAGLAPQQATVTDPDSVSATKTQWSGNQTSVDKFEAGSKYSVTVELEVATQDSTVYFTDKTQFMINGQPATVQVLAQDGLNATIKADFEIPEAQPKTYGLYGYVEPGTDEKEHGAILIQPENKAIVEDIPAGETRLVVFAPEEGYMLGAVKTNNDEEVAVKDNVLNVVVNTDIEIVATFVPDPNYGVVAKDDPAKETTDSEKADPAKKPASQPVKSKEKSVALAQTGDELAVVPFAMLACASAAIGGLALYRRFSH